MENKNAFYAYTQKWKNDFIKLHSNSKSKKTEEQFKDACDNSIGKRNKIDVVMIQFFDFVDENPLEENDIYKYYHANKNHRQKLNPVFFKYDCKILHDIYQKIDNSVEASNYSFSKLAWEKYVLFVLLKINGVYNEEHDEIFNVKKEGNREYNPATCICKYFRGILPESLNLTEYDIFRANASFIDHELGIMDRKEDVYELIDKRKFVCLINSHNQDKRKIDEIRKQLYNIYGDKVDKVITKERFETKGKMHRDMCKLEEYFIKEFIKANELTNYIRLHDAVIVSSNTKIEQKKFSNIQFIEKPISKLQVVNHFEPFYKIDRNGRVITEPFMYMEFLANIKFIRISIPENDEVVLVHLDNNILKYFNYKTDIISFLKKYINEVGDLHEKVANVLAKDIKKIIQGINLLDPKNLKLFKDKKDTYTMLFKNGAYSISISSNKIEKVEINENDGYFMEHKRTQNHHFNPEVDDKISIFEKFLIMIYLGIEINSNTILTDKQKEKMEEIYSMIGYMCHKFKSPSNTIAIYICDEDADNVKQNGGTGKSLILKAFENIYYSNFKGGNEFDPTYRHKFADLKAGTQFYMIDDAPKDFKLNNLFTQITNGTTKENKGKTAEFIDFEDSPKFITTSNFYPKLFDSSNDRRFVLYRVKTFFTKNKTPKDVFGHDLFNDWDELEWNRFYQFIFSCVYYYLNFGIKKPNYSTLELEYKNYFENDVVLNEFERILDKIKDKKEFNVRDFLNIYHENNNKLQKEKLFNHIILKNYINCYINYHNLNFRYKKSKRKWIKL